MDLTLVVDRIEDDIAVCENRKNKTIIQIKKSRLPDGFKEGSVIKYSNGKFWIDYEEQKNIEQRIEEKMESMWE